MSEEIIYFYNVEDDEYYRSRYTHKYLESLQQENQQLKKELKALNKGIKKVISKRKKWKYRYYTTKRKLKQRDEVIDEAINTIDKMIDVGYTKDLTGYFATGKNSEFGCRALIIKDILKKCKGDNNE